MSADAYFKPTIKVSAPFAGDTMTLETGQFAQQASGSVTVRFKETVILCTVVMGTEVREGTDYFPLLVDYVEKFYASGTLRGSPYTKREAKPSDEAVLASRLIDRPLRPMFPKYMRNDVQVMATVLSSDKEINPAPLALAGCSAAILLAGLPLEDAISSVRVGIKDGDFVLNPSYEDAAAGDLDLVVAGTEDAIMMIEAEANEVSSSKMLEALDFAHGYIKSLCKLQKDLVGQFNPEKVEYKEILPDETAKQAVAGFITKERLDEVHGVTKPEFKSRLKKYQKEAVEHFAAQIEAEELSERDVKEAIHYYVSKNMRDNVLASGKRLDGRTPDEVRPVRCEVGLLPRTHGSGLFQRGETQVLNLCTLDGPGSRLKVETMDLEFEERYMHHYNFPGFSVGEVRPMRGPGRREIGHGLLAERALRPVLPTETEFAYTMRTVSEVLACNGSSSMGSVCGSSLSLMDAGVPIKGHVAGIAMGLITDGEGKHVILTDIQGEEDFNGDMDFKVAGTEKGITAMQMDIKLKGLQMSLLEEAFNKSEAGRKVIMDAMKAAIPAPRAELSKYAPVIETIQIKVDKIGAVIGKGGENIQEITRESGCDISIEDDGTIFVTAPNREQADVAIKMINLIAVDPEVGTDFEGKVTRIMEFGAFVEILPGKEGLLHISKISKERVDDVNKYFKVGDTVKVRLIKIDDQGRLNLSHVPFAK